MVDGYSISDDKNKLDIQVIHHFLSYSYWAKNIPVETVQRSIDTHFAWVFMIPLVFKLPLPVLLLISLLLLISVTFLSLNITEIRG